MKRALVVVAILGLTVISAGAGEPPKGLQDPPGEGVSVRATGGPDGFGYTFFDQADGCPLSWIARDGGATQDATGDDSGAQATLGGTGIDFYGVACSASSEAARTTLIHRGTRARAGTARSHRRDRAGSACPGTGAGRRGRDQPAFANQRHPPAQGAVEPAVGSRE